MRELWKDHKLLLAALFIWLMLSQWMIFSVNRDFWFDESFSAQTVEILRQKGPIGIEFSQYDVHPPLYYSLLYVWSFLDPPLLKEHYWHRELSAVLAAIFIVFAYIGLRKVFGRAGEMASLMLPVFTSIMHYGTEARMYILLMAIAAAVFAAIAYGLKGKWFTIALAGIFFFPFIHYVAAGASFFFVIMYIVYEGKDTDWRRVAVMSLVAVLAVIGTYLMFMGPQMARIDRMWVPATNVTHWSPAVFHNFYYVDERVTGPEWLMGTFLVIYVLFSLLLVGIAYLGARWAFRKEYVDRKKRMMLAMGISVIGELVGLMVMSNVGNITFFHARYFLVVGWTFLALCLLALAYVILNTNRIVAGLLLMVFVALSAVMVFTYVEGAHLDITQLMKTVPCDTEGKLRVLHDTPFTALPFEVWSRENGCVWDNFVTTNGTVREARSAGFDAIPEDHILWNGTLPRGYFYYVTSEDVTTLYEWCNRTVVAIYDWEFDAASVWYVKCQDELVVNVSVGNFSNAVLPEDIYIPGMR